MKSEYSNVAAICRGEAGPGPGRTVRLRCNLVFSAFLLGAAVLAAHLFFLQFDSENRAHYIASVEQRWHSYERPQGRRGNICFRDGSLLAGNRKVARVIVEPELVTDVDAVARMLGFFLSKDEQQLAGKIRGYGLPGLVVAEGLPVETAMAIDSHRMRGVFTRYHFERFYPHGDFGAATTIGFAGREPVHRLGLENTFEDTLSGRDGHVVFKKDASRKRLPGSIHAEQERIDGADVITTLHPSIQAICEDEVRRTVDVHDPDSVAVIVMDPKNGEVMGAATWPSFDPNLYVDGKIGDQRNVLVHSSIEPGSTIKPLLAAYALDKGWLSPTKRYICNRLLKIDGYTIREAEASHLVGDSNGVPIKDIIAKSSNIGMAQIAGELGQHRVLEAFSSLGFFAETGIELPAEEPGQKPYGYAQRKSKKELRWPRSTLANTGFGQGLTVTPMQLATAFCTLANGGYLVRPTLVHALTDKMTAEGEVWVEPTEEVAEPKFDESIIISDDPKSDSKLTFAAYGEAAAPGGEPRVRVLSEETARIAREWLTSAVESGTGKRARLERFSAAGKTGTAQMAGAKGYQKGAYTASFAGFFPAENPSYVVLVMVVHPKSGKYYGGEVAAPVFKAIGDRISYLDQLAPLGERNAD